MGSGTAVSLKTWSEWLLWIERFPIVPGWRWTPNAWETFRTPLSQNGIPHCLDAYGNILLGARTPQEWFSRLHQGDIRTVLQAHLDHPGAVAVRSWDEGRRYNARVQGGLAKRLKGKRLFLHDADAKPVEGVLITTETEGFNERWITFKTDSEFPLPGYLRGPHQNSRRIFREGFVEGWGLDDHAGCATLLSHFSRRRDSGVFGLLTLDEETGGGGILAHLREAEKFGLSIQEYPLLLSLEVTPEYPELGFICSRGPRWRSADRNGKLTAAGEDPLALTKGVCEAGIWSRRGGCSACLAIPSEFSHNGRHENEWRAERVAFADVKRWEEMLETGMDVIYCENAATSHPPLRIFDHLEPLREAARAAADYVEAAQKVLPAWNGLHARFRLPAIRFAREEWPLWRETLLTSERWKKQIVENTQSCIDEIRRWLLIPRDAAREMPVHLFAGAPFNASNQSYGIALSVEKLREGDLNRILVHEITHWLTNPLLHRLSLPPVLKTALSEGIACKTTMDLLGLNPAQALDFREADFRRYEENAPLLAANLLRWLSGDLFSLREGRHEILEERIPPHPFLISRGGAFPKYGYFIGLQFVLARTGEKKEPIDEWLDKITGENFEEFLGLMQKELYEEKEIQNCRDLGVADCDHGAL